MFLDSLRPGARILELGCGGGRDTSFMASKGFAVDATDGTPAMVKQAQAATGQSVRLMRFDQLTADAEYDAVWAHACLLHVPRSKLPSVLAAIWRALRPGGLHFANYKLGEGEGRDLLGRLNNLPDPEWLGETYRSAGFSLLNQQHYRGGGCDGTMRDWLALTCQRSLSGPFPNAPDVLQSQS